MLTLEATHTHLYPGHRGTISGALPPGRARSGLPCHVIYSDGSAALGILKLTAGGEGQLDLSAYSTAAGTPIPAKRWRLALSPADEGLHRFRVLGRLDDS